MQEGSCARKRAMKLRKRLPVPGGGARRRGKKKKYQTKRWLNANGKSLRIQYKAGFLLADSGAKKCERSINTATKKILKSIRLTEELFDYIMECPGQGFNEKFENLIIEARSGEVSRKAELERLEGLIEKEDSRLKDLFRKNDVFREIFRDAIRLQKDLELICQDVQREKKFIDEKTEELEDGA